LRRNVSQLLTRYMWVMEFTNLVQCFNSCSQKVD
jgi:hypothetical protein